MGVSTTKGFLSVLAEECPYDMDSGEYWIMLRELFENKREATVTITTSLQLLDDGNWDISTIPIVFFPKHSRPKYAGT